MVIIAYSENLEYYLIHPIQASSFLERKQQICYAYAELLEYYLIHPIQAPSFSERKQQIYIR